MAISAENTFLSSIRETFADLKPFPGRLATSWRVAVVCALVAGIAMYFSIPESALSCYLVIFLMKADGALNTIIGSAAIIAITLLVAMMIPVLQWTVDSALIRILVMIVVSFIFIFLGAASKLGEGGSIVALIIAFILTLVNEVPVNGVISLGLRYAWEMAVLPMFVIAGFSLFFGRWSLTLLREELHDRLIVAKNALGLRDPAQCTALQAKLQNGNDDAEQCSMLVKVLHQTSSDKAAKIKADIPASYQLMFSVSALSPETPDTVRQDISGKIDDMIDALGSGKPFSDPSAQDKPFLKLPETAVFQGLKNIAGFEKTNYTKGVNDQFFASDAFTNPIYQRFALKTTLAAVLCYLFYSAINWDGIHTAMVTCYVASMGTAGDTIHKLALRIFGCLIGAAIGIWSLVYLMPGMESVGSLMVLVFVVALLAAWVTAGSEKLSYAGVQIGLAFTLTALQGFGPTSDMATARDRIIGVLVGNIAVYLVSTLIWPAPASTSIRQSLSNAIDKLAHLAALKPAERMQNIETVAQAEKLLGEVRYYFYLLPFEPSGIRLSRENTQACRYYVDKLALLSRDIYFSQDEMSDIAARLNNIAQNVLTNNLTIDHVLKEDDISTLSQSNKGLKHIDMQVTRLEMLVADTKI